MTSSTQTPVRTETETQKTLGPAGLVGLALATFIPAVGMGSMPMLMYTSAGNGSWLSVLITAVATACVGIAIVTFARRYVVTGSLYSYIAEVFGPWARWLMGAALLLGYIVQIATILVLIGMYVGSLLTSLGITAGTGTILQIIIYAIAALIVIFIVVRGLDVSVRVAVTLAAISLPIMIFIAIFSASQSGLQLVQQFTLQGSDFTGIMAGLAGGATFLFAFESSAALAAETRDPKKNVPLAVMSIPVVLGSFYILATIVQIPGLAMAWDEVEAGASGPAALAQRFGLGSGFAITIDAVLAIATFAALIGFANYGSRYVRTLALDGLLPSVLTRLSRRFNTPTAAIVGIMLVGLAVDIVLLSMFDFLTAYYTLGTLIMYFWTIPYLLICIGAVVLIVRERGRLPVGVTLAALVGGGAILWVLASSFIWPLPEPLNYLSLVFAVLMVIVVTYCAIAGARHDRRRSTVHSPTGTDD